MIGLPRLFFSFLKIGALTFGGGYAMIPLFERFFVHDYGYLSEDEFTDALVICQSLPGVIAINFAVYIGLKLRGGVGALVSGVGVALPSFILIMVIATFFFRFIENPYVEAIFMGVRVAVIALIFTAGFRILVRNRHPFGILIGVLSFLLVGLFFVHPFFVIIGMGAAGFLFSRVKEVSHDDVD